MQWETFLSTLGQADRARLLRWLDEARLYAGLAARSTDAAEVEWAVSCIDRALDALAAARILLQVPAEPQPWEDEAYRAYRTHRPGSAIRLRPAELAALREAVQQRAVGGAG